MALSARDRDAAMELLGQAQLVVALAGYPKARFVSSPKDQEAVAERLRLMNEAAEKLSPSFRKSLGTAPWNELAEDARIARGGVRPDELARLWLAVKKLAPKVAREVHDALGDDPALAFTLAAEPPRTRARSAKPSRTKR